MVRRICSMRFCLSFISVSVTSAPQAPMTSRVSFAVLFIRLLIHHVVADIKAHRLFCIHHPDNGMFFLESKIDLRDLRAYLYGCASLGSAFRRDQDEQGIEDTNARRQQQTRIHRHAPFPSLTLRPTVQR